MERMGEHSMNDVAELAGKPLRRGRTWAWTVFISMASVSVLFNIDHDITVGRMHWYLASPAGLLPLLMSIGALEIAAVWPSTNAKVIAWGVTIGAMGWSASAMGGVVLKAAPPHMELLFGLLADAAALLAVSFLLNGPSAAHAVGQVAKTIAELTERANAALKARAETEAKAARAIEELRAANAADLDRERRAHAQANADLSGQLAEANETLRNESARRQRTHEELAACRTELAGLRAGLGTAEAARRAADTAREDQAAQAERLVDSLRAQLDQARAAAAKARTTEVERDTARTELAAVRTELANAKAACEEAERSAANANAKAERLGRKLSGATAAKPAPKTAARNAGAQPAKTSAEIREDAYRRLDENPDIPAKDLAEEFRMSVRWAEMRKADHERRNGLRAVGD